MDSTLRLNQHCVIGLNSCGYSFSSSKSCFIAYPFDGSCDFEVEFIEKILRDHNIEPISAKDISNTGEFVFCNKICSKIVTAQFCIILLNQDKKKTINANVLYEYGLMTGFNKKIIPIQKNEETLPFNFQSLETIKYTDKSDFEGKIKKAIREAIKVTTQPVVNSQGIDQKIHTFLLANNMILTPIDNQGERDLYDLGYHCGFYLCNDFAGMRYTYLGVFKHLNSRQILWKVGKLKEIIESRLNSIEEKLSKGYIWQNEAKVTEEILRNLSIVLIVDSEQSKLELENSLHDIRLGAFKIFTNQDIEEVMNRLEVLK